MNQAWLFSVILLVLYVTTAAQELPCNKRTCGPEQACTKSKCSERNGTCYTKDDLKHFGEDFCPHPGVSVLQGRGDWCKWSRRAGRCRCCYYPVCKPTCVHGVCIAKDLNTNECDCDPGWFGPRCDTDLCDNQCLNGATCIGLNNCSCTPEWTGAFCQDPVCKPPCQNGGICKSGLCECPAQWTGPACETPVCDPPCHNGATCLKDNVCECSDEFTGDRCQYKTCTERTNCLSRNGTCYDKTDPILGDPASCPSVDNGRNWCSPMCWCCFGN